jgi:cytochrome P450
MPVTTGPEAAGPEAAGPEAAGPEVRLSTYADCRDAYRHRQLRQALYDEGHALMDDVIVNLHGDEHRNRRRLENRLFRRDVFLRWEHDVIPVIVEGVLAPAVAAGRGDLIALARRAMMTLAAEIAGVDRPAGTDAEFDELSALMTRLSRASTVVHAVGDKNAIVADGRAALAEFAARFLQPSLARRTRLIAEAGDDRGALPADVLTTLLVNRDALDLPPDVVLREVAYFPWVGSHSTSNALAHAMHHIFAWLESEPADRDRLRDEPDVTQRFVHESLRLHPPSPVARRRALADVELASGVRLAEGAKVVVDVSTANRDPDVFGPTAGEFDPFRTLPDGVPLWGLAFGTGFHACLGQELAGGVASDAGPAPTSLYGAIAGMAQHLIAHGARPDPADPAVADHQSVRPQYGRYPILLA